MKRTTPTIRDVAAAAGVSVATVSKYMNGAQRFSAPVEARLKEAIEHLGYRSNPLARSMITGETRTIGLAILDIRNPYFTNIVKGANRIALRHDYTLLLVDTEEKGSVITEDEAKHGKEQIQELTKQYEGKVNSMADAKEKDIMSV